jgi:hypothetical protein
LFELQRKHEEFVASLSAVILSWDSLPMIFPKLFTSPPLCSLHLRLELGLLLERPTRQAFLHALESHIVVVEFGLLRHLGGVFR